MVEGAAHSLVLEHGTVGLKIKNPFGLTGSVDAGEVRGALQAPVVVFASLAMGPIIFSVGVLAGLGLHGLDRFFRPPGRSTPSSS